MATTTDPSLPPAAGPGAASLGAAAAQACRREIARYADWIRTSALPLWARRGRDARGCFVEQLDFAAGMRETGYTRTRLIARQVAVFAQAAEGSTGIRYAPGLRLAERGWDLLRQACWLPGRGWAARLDASGAVSDATFDLYDQAFALYACASWARLSGSEEPLARALEVLDLVDRRLRSGEVRGWRPREGVPAREQNPLMHYLEALLALHDLAPLPRFAAVIAELLEVAALHLRTPEGAIAEHFGDSWEDLGDWTLIEPGHQYEWYWLLHRAAAAGFALAFDPATLFEFAADHGWSRSSGLIVDQCARNGTVLAAGHRLWPHCEALKALSVHPPTPARDRAIASLIERLFETFLATRVPGLWTDRLGPDLAPVSDHVPASSLYHLWEAHAALARLRPLGSGPC